MSIQMSWKKPNGKPTTTKHTCGGPVFGKKTPGCPRCNELLNGAAPVRWDWAERDKEDRRLGRGKYAPHVPCQCDKCTGKAPSYPPCTANQW